MKLVCSEMLIRQRLDYIQHNPVRRAHMNVPSTGAIPAQDHAGKRGLLEITRRARNRVGMAVRHQPRSASSGQ